MVPDNGAGNVTGSVLLRLPDTAMLDRPAGDSALRAVRGSSAAPTAASSATLFFFHHHLQRQIDLLAAALHPAKTTLVLFAVYADAAHGLPDTRL